MKKDFLTFIHSKHLQITEKGCIFAPSKEKRYESI